MKYLTAVFVLGLSLSSFASTVDETMKEIEAERNVTCTLVKSDAFKKCINFSCSYSMSYRCDSQADAFGVKLKVRDSADLTGKVFKTSVRSVSYTN